MTSLLSSVSRSNGFITYSSAPASTAARTLPYFREHILKDIRDGKNVIVAAHGNSLRSIVMELEKLTPEEILKVEIPTGVPIVYELDSNLKILSKKIL